MATATTPSTTKTGTWTVYDMGDYRVAGKSVGAWGARVTAKDGRVTAEVTHERNDDAGMAPTEYPTTQAALMACELMMATGGRTLAGVR